MEIKKCPYCGKTVLAISKACKHCSRLFNEDDDYSDDYSDNYSDDYSDIKDALLRVIESEEYISATIGKSSVINMNIFRLIMQPLCEQALMSVNIFRLIISTETNKNYVLTYP